MERLTTRQPPTGPWKLFFRAPIWLYRLHLGWLLGGRFLLMEHVGRRSGLVRRVVVEVVHHDRDADTYTVASGFGPRSDWYLNLKEHPDIAIRVGRRYLAVRAHFLSADEGADVMERYAREPRGGSVSPEDDALRADLADALTCALDKLSLDQRVAFVLCEVEERSAKEAGEIAGAPEATMRTRVFHAKKKLREALARSAREGGLR